MAALAPAMKDVAVRRPQCCHRKHDPDILVMFVFEGVPNANGIRLVVPDELAKRPAAQATEIVVFS